MATYAIGDLQGCLDYLLKLLDKINYNENNDQLLFAGDLVNRGPQSLETLRFVKSLPDNTITVLGNHDLSLLVMAYGYYPPQEPIKAILAAPDKAELLDWLRHQPLLYQHNDYVLTHAGIYPQWDIQKASRLAKEIEQILQSDQFVDLLANMFGDDPTQWQDDLKGIERQRFIINAFTRMRFCTQAGALELTNKTSPEQQQTLIPWFDMPRTTGQYKLLFGHWAALQNPNPTPNVFALDSGCVWGNHLSAFCLETQQFYSVPCF